MSEPESSSLRRFVSAAGLYASAAAAQRAAGFLLIPAYTRLIDPTRYGVLELLNNLFRFS